MSDDRLGRVANAIAEEALRVIYGDDLEGCAVRLDTLAAAVRPLIEAHARAEHELADLHAKGFEAVQLLSTPPADGHTLSAEDLRSLLGERLDKIHSLTQQIVRATTALDSTTQTAALPPDE